ncbi:MAG: PAS domain-containing protein [Nitrospinae bacterium]|nr:PAS domain-containing protein [Nitrospinota bacterium]
MIPIRANAEVWTLLDHAPLGACAVDENLAVVFWNRSLENWTKIRRDSIVGQNIAGFYPNLLEAKYRNRIIDVIKTGAPALFSTQLHGHIFSIPLSGGGFRSQQTTVLRLAGPDGDPLALFLIHDLTDITAQVKAYRGMRDQAMKTADELRIAKDVAEDATRLKDKFVALVAHDLKSPLSSIIGLTRIVQDDKFSPPIPRHKEILEHLFRSCMQMTQMIDELLNINRLQTGKIKPARRFFNPRIAMQMTMDILSTLAEEKGVTLVNSLSPSARIYADPPLFDEVARNLVSNAIKFCRKGDMVEAFTPDGSPSTVALRDTGVGVDSRMLPNIFRQDVKTTTHGTAGERGTGLGLPYCHEIMTAHGGFITLESKLGEGSVFYAAFPDVKPRILLIDRDTARRASLRDTLQTSLDAQVVETDGLAGVSEALRDKPAHLVVRGFCKGENVTREEFGALAKIGGMADAPVIATGPDDDAIGKAALVSGARAYVAASEPSVNIVKKARQFLE